ncbi:DNA repair and recombination protein RadB [uncultured archaeon]|nr:DNA repair and recombination protein RadB [uncultured archaeon]
MIKKTKTGIPGVDELIGGGIPDKAVIIVSGSPGIGKSNFAMQYIYNGATMFNEPGVYITVEDTPENVKAYAQEFGWDLDKLEKENKIAIVAQPIYGDDKEMKRGGKDRKDTLSETIKRIGAKRVVLDSVTLFKYLFNDDIARRINLLNFIKQVKDSGCTTVMVAEQHESSPNITYLDEHFLADGLLLLFWSRHREKAERCFVAVKMRGCEINSDMRPMKITNKGVIVYPTQVPLTLASD